MKAMVVVAHPDDCIIFAYSFMNAYPTLDWTVCYLTYNADDHRGSELTTFWNRRNIKTKFLGYVDNWQDIENNCVSFNQQAACIDIQLAIADQDIIVTHNANGETGHPHHIFVHLATSNHPGRITFAGMGTGTDKFTIPPGTYSIDELPTHGKIVAGFHQNHHTNEYIILDNIKMLLGSINY